METSIGVGVPNQCSPKKKGVPNQTRERERERLALVEVLAFT